MIDYHRPVRGKAWRIRRPHRFETVTSGQDWPPDIVRHHVFVFDSLALAVQRSGSHHFVCDTSQSILSTILFSVDSTSVNHICIKTLLQFRLSTQSGISRSTAVSVAECSSTRMILVRSVVCYCSGWVREKVCNPPSFPELLLAGSFDHPHTTISGAIYEWEGKEDERKSNCCGNTPRTIWV